jgi:hypothetical protein
MGYISAPFKYEKSLRRDIQLIWVAICSSVTARLVAPVVVSVAAVLASVIVVVVR